MRNKSQKIKKTSSLIAILMLVFSQLFFFVVPARANVLTSGSLSISDSRPAQTGVTYTSTWSNVDTTTTIRCVEIEFATTAAGGTIPTEMSLASATVNASSNFVTGVSGWSGAASNGVFQATDNTTGATPSSSSDRTFILDGVVNGSVDATGYYGLLTTYTDASCTAGNEVDTGTAMFIYTDGQLVSATVDPSLTFTIAGVASGQTINGATATNVATTTDANTIPFGSVSASSNKIAAHDLSIATNAAEGYTVYIRYTGALTYGTETIGDHTGTNETPTAFSAAGTEAFGYATNDLTRFSTSDYWAGFTTSNAAISTAATGPVNNTFRVGYQVGVGGNTLAGTYTTTIVLTATPTY